MVGEPFVLPAQAAELTESERALVLEVIAQLLAKRAEVEVPSAPVISLRQFVRSKEQS